MFVPGDGTTLGLSLTWIFPFKVALFLRQTTFVKRFVGQNHGTDYFC